MFNIHMIYAYLYETPYHVFQWIQYPLLLIYLIATRNRDWHGQDEGN